MFFFFYLAHAGCRGPKRLALKVSGVLMCLMSAARTAAATALHQTDSPQLPGVTSHGTRDDRARTRPALVTSCSACHTLQHRRFTWQDPLHTCPTKKDKPPKLRHFVNRFAVAKTPHGVQSVLIPSDARCTPSPTSVEGTLGFICHLHPPLLLQPSLIIF